MTSAKPTQGDVVTVTEQQGGRSFAGNFFSAVVADADGEWVLELHAIEACVDACYIVVAVEPIVDGTLHGMSVILVGSEGFFLVNRARVNVLANGAVT